MREQLHATSMMSLQNRFVIESRMAGDHGVCDVIGEECCTLIPMHTGSNGSLTGVLKDMKRLRDEHVNNSNGNTQIKFLGLAGKIGMAEIFNDGRDSAGRNSASGITGGLLCHTIAPHPDIACLVSITGHSSSTSAS